MVEFAHGFLLKQSNAIPFAAVRVCSGIDRYFDCNFCIIPSYQQRIPTYFHHSSVNSFLFFRLFFWFKGWRVGGRDKTLLPLFEANGNFWLEEGLAIGIEIFDIKESKNEVIERKREMESIKERKKKKVISPAVIPRRMITPWSFLLFRFLNFINFLPSPKSGIVYTETIHCSLATEWR